MIDRKDDDMRTATAAMTAFGLVLSGCGQADAPAKTETAQDTHIAAAAPTPSAITRAAPPPTGKPVGPAERRTAAAREEIGTAADVSQLQALPDQNAKVFSLSGGDPAVNGLVTYFALFGGSALARLSFGRLCRMEGRGGEGRTCSAVGASGHGGAEQRHPENGAHRADRLPAERRDAAGCRVRQHVAVRSRLTTGG